MTDEELLNKIYEKKNKPICKNCDCSQQAIEKKTADTTYIFKNGVDHPDHYQGNSIEVIDIIEDFQLDFHLGNAVKYILRSDKKGAAKEDLEKAIWYIQRHITQIFP